VLQGIEASPEIQLVARQVVDENKRLRLLLAQLGVTNQTVEGYVQCMYIRDQLGGADQGDGAQALETAPKNIYGGAGVKAPAISTALRPKVDRA